LYIEDDVASIEIIQLLLAPYEGATFLTARTAEEGIANNTVPDLILLDINLPAIEWP
jgi:CheY-like chemotaxis protein